MIGVGAIANVVDTVVKRIWPEPGAAEAQAVERLKAEIALSIAQMDVNKVEAANESLFVSGWRPSVGWVCSSALAWNFLFQPMAVLVSQWVGTPVSPEALPSLDLSTLLPILAGMLGLGWLRTEEKKHGVNTRR